MSTKFEAAARTLAEQWHDRDLSRSHGLSGCVLIGVDGYLPAARDVVRLVLEAIREPDEAMVDAGWEATAKSIVYGDEVWKGMIDVLLAEARGGK